MSGIIRKNNLQDFWVSYIDDVLIFLQSFDDHVKHIRLVFDVIRSAGFRLKFMKCKFAVRSVNYLGHIIEQNTIHPLQDNLVSIRDFPRPTTRKHIRQFLGKINFYNKYIPNSAKKLSVFHNLLHKNVPFDWTNECEKTFEEIKLYLVSSLILAVFDPELPINIYTDASGEVMGVILKQVQSDGKEKPVAYFSRKLNNAQKCKKTIYIESLLYLIWIIYGNTVQMYLCVSISLCINIQLSITRCRIACIFNSFHIC